MRGDPYSDGRTDKKMRSDDKSHLFSSDETAMEVAVVLALMAAWIAIASGYPDDIRIGVLLPKEEGDGVERKIVERVLRQRASLQVVTERLEGDADFHYHKAACRLQRAGCCSAVLSPSCRPLPGQVALACPGAPSEAPDDRAQQEAVVGMRPDTTRATLDLLRDLGWQELLYLHDHPHGAEKLQVMFRVGYSALRLRVAGLLHARSAREAAQLLLREEQPRRVLLDVESHVAQEVLSRMTHAGRTQHTFLLMQPTLPDFWRSPELRALDVIGFSLPPSPPPSADFGQNLASVEELYFYDAALFLSSASAAAWRSPQRPPDPSSTPEECQPVGGGPPHQDHRVADVLKKVSVWEGLTGSLQFSPGAEGSRTNVTLTVKRTSRHGPLTYGWWSDAGKVGGIRRNNRREGALPQIQEKRVLRIVTRLSEPFMMEGDNGTEGEFEGFCADLASALCAALRPPLECHVYAVPDGREGDYDPHRGTWDGMVGEIVTGRADVAVGELLWTAGRSRAVDFLEPFLATSLSLLLARPSPSPLLPLSWGVWGAAAGAALLCGLCLHVLGRRGAPDSIEASSAIWERRLTPLMSGWLTLGSALLQPTGVYPRSLSSRVLAGSWWAFTGFLGCMLVASMAAQLQLQPPSSSDTPQLRQLHALSLEAVLAEALENGWPEIGVVSPSFAEDVIQESSVPLLVRLRDSVRRVRSEDEGAALAQEPGFALLTQSAWAERAAARRPCRLAAVHGSAQQGALAVALAQALEPNMKEGVRAAFEGLHASGYLGHLHRKWWIENSQCKQSPASVEGGLSSSSLLIGVGAALLILLLSFGVQLSRRIRTKESRRQQLTFEDINFDQRLPTPPPELLAPPPPVLEVPEIEGGGSRSEESFKDFFDRMRTASSS